MSSDELVIVLAADENFIRPLAVTVKSLLDNLAADRRISVSILDGGLSEASKNRLLTTWRSHAVSKVDFLTVDREAVNGLTASGHVNLTTYYRMLIPRILSKSVRRVIYLDCDVIVRSDLGMLWDFHFGEELCGAVQDCAVPYVDSAVALQTFSRCAPYLVARRPLPNHVELEVPGHRPYFNAGVLLIDVEAWRREDLAGQMLECLKVNRQHIRWWDQYALNVVLAGRWGMLDPRWNQQAHVFQYPSWDRSPFDEQTFNAIRNDPYIVHFSSPVKPWHAECRHPYRDEWFQVLDRTAWKGWRPAPLNVFQRAYRAGYWKVREMVRLTLRKTQMLLGGRRLK